VHLSVTLVLTATTLTKARQKKGKLEQRDQPLLPHSDWNPRAKRP
jgi:hypothetical protein